MNGEVDERLDEDMDREMDVFMEGCILLSLLCVWMDSWKVE